YNWLKNLLLWPIKNSLKISASLGSQDISDLRDELERNLLSELSELAKQQPIQEDSELALDWFNGRRTPDVNPSLTAALFSLDLEAIQSISFRPWWRPLVLAPVPLWSLWKTKVWPSKGSSE